MKKRIIPVLIVLTILIGLLAFPTSAASGTLKAGYSKVTIDPNFHPDGAITGLPMGGYGALMERLSTGRMDDTGDGKITDEDGLFATCVALTDQYGTTMIHFGVDNTNASQEWTNEARSAVVTALKSYGVPYGNVFITASHSHSSPSLTFDKGYTEAELTALQTSDPDTYAAAMKVKTYREWVCQQMAAAAVAAMKDQVAVTMTKGSVDASDVIGKMYSSASTAQKTMNHVRHYTSTKNGETIVGGSNFGNVTSTNTKEVSEPNDVMQLIQFTPTSGSKDPIVIVNWTAHATTNSSGGSGGANTSTYGGVHHTDISSDYINSLRSALENTAYRSDSDSLTHNNSIYTNYYKKLSSTQTYRVSFMSGAAGNITPSTSYDTSTPQDPDVVGEYGQAEGRYYGLKLGAIALYGLQNSMSDALDTSSIRVETKNFIYDRQVPSTDDRDFIYALREETVGNQTLVAFLTTNSTNWSKKSDYYNYNGNDFSYLEKFTSRYQLGNLNGLVTNYYDLGKTTGFMTVSAIAIGTELSITVNPAELADRYSSTATLANTTDNDWEDLNSNTYGTPLVMGYTNGASGYVPNALAYSYNSGSNGDGADLSDNYITGSYESSGATFAMGTGEQLVNFYAEMLADVNTTEARVQCACGGKAAGMTDHTCSNIEFLPWDDATSLPTTGNYYLTTDVVISAQHSVTGTLHLDLNGHDITHKVAAEQGELAVAGESHQTRIFSVSSLLSITDSTGSVGTISRDLSNLTTEQQAAITNYGLCILVGHDADAILYAGTLDSTGATTKGGGCVSSNYADSRFTMYGGTLKGCTVSSSGGVLYNAGTAKIYGGTMQNGTAPYGGLVINSGTFEMYGGTLTGGNSNNGGALYNTGTAKVFGGSVTGNKTISNGNCPGIYCAENGTLTIGGTAEITGNQKYNNGVAMNSIINIRFASVDAMATNFTVSGTFIGKAGVYAGTGTNGQVIGVSDNASFGSANLTQDFYSNFTIAVSGDDIIFATVRSQCECGGTATSGKYGHTCQKIDFLPWNDAENLPSSGNYYLITDVTIPAQKNLTGTLRLDLNGHSITHKLTGTTNPRVFSLSSNAYLSIADSSDTPGTVTRDLSNLTDDQKTSINNWGLILLIDGSSNAVLYNGTLDATGMYAGGGACVSLQSANNSFKMYGGSLLGGICDSGAVMYNRGKAEFYGGTVTGGVTKVAGGACGGIYVVEHNDICGTVTIGGDVEIYGNKKSNGNEVNIRYATEAKMADNFTITGDFTGKASFYVASRTDKQVIGINNNASFTSDNFYLDIYSDGAYDIALDGEDIILAAQKVQCECGGTAKGKYGHTCADLTWKPWNHSSSLPTDEGNYYLTTDVTTTAQKGINAAIRIDLNGHDITHKVKSGATNTRVLSVGAGGSLVITDSTANPGTVTRDLSNLTTEQKEAITNYGLLVMLSNEETTGSFTLYNGILDATGMYTCGGAVSNLNNKGLGSKIVIYGGTIKGPISRENPSATSTDGGYGGCIYSQAPVEVHGGTITGGQAEKNGGGIFLTRATSSLLLTGDAKITGNHKADGTASNVYSSYFSTNGNVTVAGTFTGTVGFQIASPAVGARVAVSDGAVIAGATLSVDNYPVYAIEVSGTDLVMKSAYVSSITNGDTVTYQETLSNAIDAYPGGDAVITLLKDCDEDVAFTQATNLDLNGYDLTGTVTTNGTLTVLDSQTDDYTVNDSFGYGKLPASVTNVVAAEGYLKITETDGISFHRLTLQTVGINLRPSEAGLYYTSEFGGDEIVANNVTAFGVALGANEEPSWRDNTYTAFTKDSWIAGANSDGSSKNKSNGTILKDILKPGNPYSINKRNATAKVYGVAYIDLADGTRLKGNLVQYSLREIIEGISATGFTGVDDLWDNLNDTQRSETVTMYETYEKIMSSWDIPNIKQAMIDGQDDGVLKILMIGHSLGNDSTYFLPQVLKNETGKDVVVGVLYHSGCRLNQHVDYLENSSTEYAYLEYDTSKQTQWNIWETGEASGDTEGFDLHYPNHPGGHDSYIGAGAASAGNPNKYGVTMQFGIEQHDWDIVVMQAGVFEAANIDDSSTYSPNITADIKTIQSYVRSNDANKYTTPKFAWNITWSAPEDKELTTETSYDTLLASKFDNSSLAMYNAIIETVQEQVLTACDWSYVFPTGTALQNAKTIMTDKEVYRDMIHGKNFVRLMAAYTWYCELFDKDISECGFDPIGSEIRFAEGVWADGEDYTLTDEEKRIMKDCIRNAISNPYEVTQIKEDDGVLKVLVIGHSTGMDPAYFMPVVAKANGVDMIVGDLYHSGCSLRQHEDFLTRNVTEYAYLEYDNTADEHWRIWENSIGANDFVQHYPNQAHDGYIGTGDDDKYGVTMQFAIQQHDWDVVIMMGGRFETTDVTVPGSELDITDIGVIRDYVLANDIDKTTVPAFAWNTLWTNPENDEDWKATLSSGHLSSYNKAWSTVETYFEGSTQCVYEHLVAGLQDLILPTYNFDYLLHNNTVVQNAKQDLTNAEIYRDYTHATDFTRMMVACNWFCGITGQSIEDITIPSIPAALRFSTENQNSGEAYTLTSEELATLKKCVGDALTTPYEVTE